MIHPEAVRSVPPLHPWRGGQGVRCAGVHDQRTRARPSELPDHHSSPSSQLFLLLLTLIAPAALYAQDVLSPTCQAAPAADCAITRADDHRLMGEPKQALAALKAARKIWPDDARLPLLLARAYQDTGNRVWARRTLARAAAAAPHDCQRRAWLAWQLTADADLDGARRLLHEPGCPRSAAEGARWQLLTAFVARAEGDPEAARHGVLAARDEPEIFTEDGALSRHLVAGLWPFSQAPASLKADLKLGWSQNPRIDSPDEQSSVGDPSSMGELWLRARLGAPSHRLIRPRLEVDARARGLSSDEARENSYVSGGVKPSLAWSNTHLLVALGYRFEAVLMAKGDRYDAGPLWFYQGHRGELELLVGQAVSVFAGGGRREFRELGRTRWEGDLSVGGGVPLGRRFFLLGAVAGRLHHAENPAFHRWGLTGLASLKARLFRDASLQTVLSARHDDYFDSRGRWIADDTRRDWVLKGRVEAWLPRILATQLGLSYEASRRITSVDAFEAGDHRVLLMFRWSFKGDPWAPRSIQPAGHVPLPHGMSGGGGSMSDQLRELLKQDEEAQRASSCLN